MSVAIRNPLAEIKEQLSEVLLSPENLSPPLGVPTGLDTLDEFLLWKGFPKGDLTLLHGKPGSGATSLWICAAKKLHQDKKWAAWINSDWELVPQTLKRRGVDLKKLLVVQKPEESEKLFWILQELISSRIFDLIGCHLSEKNLKLHQLQKLKKLARTYKVSLIFLTHQNNWITNPLFSLVIDCERELFTIKRAIHRPTPFSFSGGAAYAYLMPELATKSRLFLR